MNAKEQVYDGQIGQLMAQIIGICQKNGIAMVASFAIGCPGNPTLRCSTHLPDARGEFDPSFDRASRIMEFPR